MKLKSSNFLYQSEYDGAIFKYKLKGLSAIILPCFGFSKRFELPLNIVLKYKMKRRLSVFQSICFIVYQHKMLVKSKIGASTHGPLLFISFNQSSFWKVLQVLIEKNIQETRRGSNVGLVMAKIEQINEFYELSREESDNA